jgi:hypothetical protein
MEKLKKAAGTGLFYICACIGFSSFVIAEGIRRGIEESRHLYYVLGRISYTQVRDEFDGSPRYVKNEE